MDSDAGGKIKAKKSRNQDKPYSRNQSLLNRIKDSVKEVLSPSWLIDIVSSVKKNPQSFDGPGVGSSRQSEGVGESFLATLPQAPSHVQATTSTPMVPLSKPNFSETSRLVTPPKTVFGKPLMKTNRYVAPDVDDMAPVNQTPLPFTFAKTSGRATPIENGDDNVSESSDVSNSVVSSMAPQADKRDYQKEILKLDDRKLEQLNKELTPLEPDEERGARNMSKVSNSSQLLDKSRTLWSDESSRHPQQEVSFSNRPSFTVSSFATSSIVDRSSQVGSDYKQSPFYPGKTTYGGASSLRRSRLGAAAPYQSSPARRQVKVKQLTTSSESSATTSSTAKRILETLEKMATPLADARKIPSNQSSLEDSVLQFTPSSYNRRPAYLRQSASRTPSESMVASGPPVSRRTTPRPASVGRHYLPPATHSSPLLKVRGQDTDKATSGNSSAGVTAKSGGKMKREKTQHYSVRKMEDEDMVEAPDLPTGVTLPINSMSGFNFTPLFLTTKPDSGHKQAASVSTTSLATNTVQPDSSPSKSETFLFSSPIKKDTSAEAAALHLPSHQEFKFTSPVDVSKLAKAKAKPKTQPSPTFSGGLQPAVELKAGSVMDILGKPVSGGFGGVKPAAELVTGSVMDVLKKGTAGQAESSADCVMQDKVEDKTKSSGFLFGKPPADINKPDAPTCAAFQSSKPAPASAKTALPPPFVQKHDAGSWECDTCMIRNKPNASSCAACQSSKPASASDKSSMPPVQKHIVAAETGGTNSTSSKQTLGVSAKGLFVQVKPVGSWDCETCLITNKPEAANCAACQSSKPASASTQTAAPPSFIQKHEAGSWECDMCMIRNKPDVITCAACSSNKPGGATSSSSQQMFGASVKGLFGQEKKPDTDSCVASQSNKPGAPITGGFKPNLGGQGLLFSSQTKKSSEPWECITCAVNNKGQVIRCAACETPRPGYEDTGISFKPVGSSSDSSAALAPGGGIKFSFGVASAASESTASSPASSQMPTTTGFLFKPASGDSTTSLQSSSSGVASVFKSVAVTKEGSTDEKSNLSMEKSTTADNTGSQPVGGFQFKGPSNVGTSSPSVASVFKSVTVTKEGSADEKSNLSMEKSTTGSQPVGGFQFKGPSESGFMLKSTSKNGEDKAEESQSSKPLSGGFVFGSNDIKSDTEQSSIFGQTINKSDVQTKVKDSLEQSAKPAFAFGTANVNNDKKQPMPTFNFGAAPVKASSENEPKPPSTFIFGSTNANSNTSTEPAKSGFAFGVNSDANAKPPIGNDGESTTGGFTFAAKPGNCGSGPELEPTQIGQRLQEPAKPALFNFGTSTASGSAGTFTFGAAKQEETQQQKPVFGASNLNSGSSGPFSSLPSDQPKPASTATFNFGKTPQLSDTVPNIFTSQSSTGSVATKRSLDRDSEPQAKKSANTFGTGSTNSPFNGPSAVSQTPTFGSATLSLSGEPATMGSVPAFASPATFSFGSQQSGGIQASVPAFGSSANPPAFGNAVNPPAFGSSANTPAFGTTANPTFGTATNPTAFGSTSNTSAFGTTTNPPAFGSTSDPPAFGSTSNAPVFGSTTNPPAFGATANPPAFGSSTNTPAFGSTANPPAFGSTSNPPAFGSTTNTSAFGGTQTQTPFSTPFASQSGTGGFSFGSSATNQASTFGTPSTNTAPTFNPNATSGFNFSAAANAPTPGVFNFNASQGTDSQGPNAGGFNFGSADAQPTFNFSAGPVQFNASSNSSNMFNPPSAPGKSRLIKKATRKLRR